MRASGTCWEITTGVVVELVEIKIRIEMNTFWDVDIIVAICAIVVSILGIGLGVYFNWKTLKITINHNRKSVRPALKFDRAFDELNFEIDHGLKNSGTGPAFITKLLFFYDNKEYKSLAFLLSSNISVYHSIVKQSKSIESNFDDREVIASSDYQNIYKSSFIENKYMFEIKKILRRTEIYVEYESIYEEKYFMREFINTSTKIVL